ncbi:DoxX family membrane protein [Streptomyces sp. SID1328]|uniref:DoxX family protein n=1 Tax=Streptomyces sp. SID1328 TaxID=2690250 RepID=UPI00136A2783|nr:DoxX family membrane protein [Streptomyces sp. SID1328]MYV40244.1 DoxX family membrane protein [Streptomyces sp. SID1328]
MTTTRTYRPAGTTDRAVFGSAADWGLLLIRLTFGLLMAGHGAQKLFGILGGHGLTATARGFEGLGYHPGKVYATIGGLSELLGGLGLAVGLLTPLAAAALIGVMINAMALVTGPHGLWESEGGVEYSVCIAVVALGVAAIGPGRLAFDRFFRWGSGGWWPAAFALGLGGIGAAITLSL